MEEYTRLRYGKKSQEPVDDQSNIGRSASELAKIWFLILLALIISLYFIVELLSLIFNMILFISFRVILPIFGVYVIFNFFNIGKILPQVNQDVVMKTHRLLLRSISWSDRLRDAVDRVFE